MNESKKEQKRLVKMFLLIWDDSAFTAVLIKKNQWFLAAGFNARGMFESIKKLKYSETEIGKGAIEFKILSPNVNLNFLKPLLHYWLERSSQWNKLLGSNDSTDGQVDKNSTIKVKNSKNWTKKDWKKKNNFKQ